MKGVDSQAGLVYLPVEKMMWLEYRKISKISPGLIRGSQAFFGGLTFGREYNCSLALLVIFSIFDVLHLYASPTGKLTGVMVQW